MLTASCLVVLTAGNLVGAVAKGVTGFGSAILNLCVWVAATCGGVDGGSLQQAVLSECVCSEACALPLLLLTRARSTADWRLVTTLTAFGAVGAPLGAALLTNLDPRKVELAMGLVLLAVICLHCRLAQRARGWLQRRSSSCSGVDAGKQQPAYARLSSSSGSGGSCSSGSSTAAAAEAPTSTIADAVATGVAAASEATDGSSTLAVAAAVLPQQHDSCAAVTCGDGSSASQALHTDDEGAALLPPAAAGQHRICGSSGDDGNDGSVVVVQVQAASGKQADAEPGGSSSSCQRCAGAGCWRCMLWTWWSGAVGSPAARRALAAGSVAGCLAGIMAGMTGMGGPPLMMLFDQMKTPKDVVRGSNAVMNVLQARVLAYVLMGAFMREDLALYLSASAAGFVGLAAGHCLAARMDQAAFSRVLVALMVLCCALMLASAAGLAH